MKTAELVAVHLDWLRCTAYAMCRDRDMAEDLASETACKCLYASRLYDSDRDFKPWAKVVMRNTWLTQERRRNFIDHTPVDEADIGDSRLADDIAQYRSTLSLIRDLSEKSLCIEPLMLYARGYTYAEIGTLTGIPIGTVKSRISKGKAMLRRALGLQM